MSLCFNPCFNGSGSGSMPAPADHQMQSHVSILVLMEVALEVPFRKYLKSFNHVSILVLMEVALEVCQRSERSDNPVQFQSLF